MLRRRASSLSSLESVGLTQALFLEATDHSKVNLAMDVYDQANEQDLRGALLHVVTRREEVAWGFINCVAVGGPSRI